MCHSIKSLILVVLSWDIFWDQILKHAQSFIMVVVVVVIIIIIVYRKLQMHWDLTSD